MNNEAYFERFKHHMLPWAIAFVVWFFTNPSIRHQAAGGASGASLFDALVLAPGLIVAASAVAIAGSAVSAWIAGAFNAKIENGKRPYIWGIGSFVSFVLIVWIALNSI